MIENMNKMVEGGVQSPLFLFYNRKMKLFKPGRGDTMVTVSISQLREGDVIVEDVYTKLGGLLFAKNRTVTQRDIEILRAFQVPTVAIEKRARKEEAAEQGKKERDKSDPVGFYKEYAEMLSLIKRVFQAVGTGQSFSIFDVRSRLERLLERIDQYNLLTFSTKYANLHDYIYHSSVMVSLTSYQLAKWHGGFSANELMQIALAGLLHDLGNARIDPALLEKTTRLSPQDMEEIKKHTIFGYHILKNVPTLNEGVKLCALQHHEKEDGSGYPLGLRGAQTHIYSKIVAVADIFHAMTNNRMYRKAQSPYLVLEHIFNESFGKLDPSLVQTFIQKVAQIHSGTVVRLSDNRVGEIVFTDRSNPTRPMVRVNGTFVNLSAERNLYIKEVL